MPWTRLFEASWWNVTVWNGSCKFAFLTGEPETMNAEGSEMARIGIWLAGTSTLTQSHVISNHYNSLQRFQGRSAFSCGKIDALKIQLSLKLADIDDF